MSNIQHKITGRLAAIHQMSINLKKINFKNYRLTYSTVDIE